MKFVQFTCPCQDAIRVGYIDESNRVVDINLVDPTIHSTMLGILRHKELCKVYQLPPKHPPSIPMESVELKAPIYGVDKILCIALNYKDHCEQHCLMAPSIPTFFSKFASSITGPNDPVRIKTNVTEKVDWEAELGIVIGQTACCVSSCDACNYVFGCIVAQDISARDWLKEKNGGQLLLGKSMDSFCPIGPWIVTRDEVGDLDNLQIKCSVNGVVKQCSNTCQMIHKIPALIERVSSVMTLLPGDLILTGTPAGVGMFSCPPEYLNPGDVITSEVEHVGELVTKVESF